MRSSSSSLAVWIGSAGALYLVAIIALVITRTPLGSPLFFLVAAAMAAAYLVLLVRSRGGDQDRRTAWFIAMLFAIAFRAPLALAPVGPDSDMIRYLWDGRVQRLGYNPYEVLPADPELAATHTGGSAQMPSRRARTPYPPAAQLFFRLVVGIHDSPLAMKLALVACDLLTMVLLSRWLSVTGASPWLLFAYAWNPLVVLEIAHSGHIDALGVVWIVAAACWLTERRTMLATLAFVMAIASKLLPIVLVPLLIGRIKLRDAVAGALLLGLLYWHFHHSSATALGAVPSVIAYIRFNGPVFAALAATVSPTGAAALAVVFGLVAAAVFRWARPVTDTAAWAWPMAIALACAPVVYPWYSST